MMIDRADLSARESHAADGKRFDDIISDKDFASPRVPDRDRQTESKTKEPEKDAKEKVWSKARENQKDDGKKSKPVTQRDAMEIFLHKMENEVGIKPEAVLQAFAELSVNELVAPPEESATKVIDKLDLEV